MTNEIDRILMNSTKAEFLEKIEEALRTMDKAVIIFVQPKENGKYTEQCMVLGMEYGYEVYGLLQVAQNAFQEDDSIEKDSS